MKTRRKVISLILCLLMIVSVAMLPMTVNAAAGDVTVTFKVADEAMGKLADTSGNEPSPALTVSIPSGSTIRDWPVPDTAAGYAPTGWVSSADGYSSMVDFGDSTALSSMVFTEDTTMILMFSYIQPVSGDIQYAYNSGEGNGPIIRR